MKPADSLSLFESLFGRPPSASGTAPGRVNLIGEHTDYNGGFVLPTAIPQRTHVQIALRDDALVGAWSGSTPAASALVRYCLGREEPAGDWADYVRGVTRLLRAEGHVLAGFDARIVSDVPLGSGLSSSASLTVSLMRALRASFALQLDDVQIALYGQRVENEFVGARVGIMDPMAASLADEGTALFLDARSMEFERVPLPAGADLMVVHSGVSHRLAEGGGDYNTRRLECERAAEMLGVAQLRDLGPDDMARVERLPEPLNRRARHVVTENARVLEAVRAMRAGDLAALGQLFCASHESMTRDYEVSIPEIDLLVDLAREDAAVYGARLTGGGFGGSVVMLARCGHGAVVAERLAGQYAERTNLCPKVLVPVL